MLRIIGAASRLGKFAAPGIHKDMRVVCKLIVALAVILELVARAEGPSARKPRPPPDYSKRVHFHELPTSIAPPQAPDVDKNSPEFASPAQPELLPAASLITTAPAPDSSEPLAPSPSLLEIMKESARRQDLRSKSTGWGWLADDIATNRARRAEREARQRAREENEEYSEYDTDEATSSERKVEVAVDEKPREHRRETERNSAETRRNAPRSFDSPWFEIKLIEEDLVSAKPAEPRAGAMPRFSVDRDVSDPVRDFSINRYDTINRAALTDPIARGAREAPEPSSAARSVFEGIRVPRDETIWAADRLGDNGARLGWGPVGGAQDIAPMWSAPMYQPMRLAPSDVSLTPAPIVSPPANAVNAVQTPPAMGVLGTERERAAPRTLPW